MNADDSRLQQARHLLTTLPTKAGHDLAYEVLTDYLREYPEDADAWYLAGQSATRPVDAIACLERALVLNPEHVEASVLLAGLKGDALG